MYFFDLGVHVVDLILWWLGEPAEFTYEDDAMGGFEANCRLHLEYPNGCLGEVRLSKDWENENHHTFYFENGFVRWKVGDANGIQICLEGMDPLLCGKIKKNIVEVKLVSQRRMISGLTPNLLLNNCVILSQRCAGKKN